MTAAFQEQCSASWSEWMVLSSEEWRSWWAAVLGHSSDILHCIISYTWCGEASLNRTTCVFWQGVLPKMVEKAIPLHSSLLGMPSLHSVALHSCPNDLHHLSHLKLTVDYGKTYFLNGVLLDKWLGPIIYNSKYCFLPVLILNKFWNMRTK